MAKNSVHKYVQNLARIKQEFIEILSKIFDNKNKKFVWSLDKINCYIYNIIIYFIKQKERSNFQWKNKKALDNCRILCIISIREIYYT